MPYMHLTGKGIDRTPSQDGLITPLPIVMNGYDQTISVGLLQGSPAVTVVEHGLGVRWDTLPVYYRRQAVEQTVIPAAVLAMPVSPQGPEAAWKWERTAFAYGAQIYNDILGRLKKEQPYTVPTPGEPLGRIHLNIDDLASVQDRIFNYLELSYYGIGRLRDDFGEYRWIGLDHINDKGEARPVSTPIVIPDMVNGSAPINLRASVKPYTVETEQYFTPMADNSAEAVFAGIIHGFEAQEKYQESCAIRAAFLKYVFNADWSFEQLFASAARAGMYPRLGSTCQKTGMTFIGKLIALSMAVEYFKKNYGTTFQRQVVQARFQSRLEGATKILENQIMRYVHGSYANIQAETNAKTGLFFFPANNQPGLYAFGICKDLSETPDKATRIIPSEGSRPRVTYKTDIARVNKAGVLQVDEALQATWDYYNVTIEPIHSIADQIRFLRGGFRERKLDISDVVDPTSVMPSELIKAMTIGWTPAYAPVGIVSSTDLTPMVLRDYADFSVTWGDKKPV